MLLSGVSNEARCNWKLCRKSFTKTDPKQKFCSSRCCSASSKNRWWSRAHPVTTLEKKCPECKDIFIYRSNLNPRPKYCSGLCRSRVSTRRQRWMYRLLDLGWSRRVGCWWVDPDTKEAHTLTVAVKVSGLVRQVKPPKYEYHQDGITVWVNGETGLIGRFGKFGVDVHRISKEQRTKGECLACTHEETGINEWHFFVRMMLKHYAIDLSHARYTPHRLKKGASHGPRELHRTG